MGFTSAARRALITCASEEGPPRDGGAGRGGREPGQPGMPAFRYLIVPRRLPALDQPATTARSGTARSPCTRRPGRSARCGASASGRRRRSPGRWPPCPATRTSTVQVRYQQPGRQHGDDHRDHAQPCPPARLVFSPGPLPATSGTGNRQRCRGCGGGRKVAGERAELALRGCGEDCIEAMVELRQGQPALRVVLAQAGSRHLAVGVCDAQIGSCRHVSSASPAEPAMAPARRCISM